MRGGRTDDERSGRVADDRSPTPASPGHGHVRVGGGHLADERVHLGGGPRSGHDRQQRAVRHRVGGAGLGRVHPHREQGRRSHRPQAGLCVGPARLCHRRAGHGARPEHHRRHRVLGHSRRTGRVAPAALHAVPHPRQLRRRGAAPGVRPRGRGRRDRRRRRAAAGWLHHHLPVVARRVPPRGGRHRRRPLRHQARARRPVHRRARRRRRGCDALGLRHGRHRAGHPRLAGRRGVRWCAHRGRRARYGRPDLVARAPKAPGPAHAARPRPVPIQGLPVRDHRSDAPADRPRRHDDRAADLPADGPRVQRHGRRPVAGPALAQHVRRRPGGGEEGR